MKMKKSMLLIPALLFLAINCVFVSAITGSIGNSKMVLYPEVNGWTNTIIAKTILVKNVNDIPVNITLTAEEESKEFIEILEDTFILEPGEEKKAEFLVKVKKEGTYEGRINIFFKSADPESKEPGVVLSSTIVVIAKKDQGYEEDEEETLNEDEENTDDVTGAAVNENSFNGKKLFIWSTAILLLILLLLLYALGKKRNKSKHRIKNNK